MSTHGFQLLDEQLRFPRWYWPLVTVLLMVLILAGYVFSQDGITEDETAQAVADASREAERDARAQLIRQKALQDQCGGPEATVKEKARGGYDCVDKKGNKRKTIPGLARPALKPVTYKLPAFSVRASSCLNCAKF